MRLIHRVVFVSVLLVVGWLVSYCGSVTIGDLDPAEFTSATATPSPTSSPTP